MKKRLFRGRRLMAWMLAAMMVFSHTAFAMDGANTDETELQAEKTSLSLEEGEDGLSVFPQEDDGEKADIFEVEQEEDSEVDLENDPVDDSSEDIMLDSDGEGGDASALDDSRDEEDSEGTVSDIEKDVSYSDVEESSEVYVDETEEVSDSLDENSDGEDETAETGEIPDGDLTESDDSGDDTLNDMFIDDSSLGDETIDDESEDYSSDDGTDALPSDDNFSQEDDLIAETSREDIDQDLEGAFNEENAYGSADGLENDDNTDAAADESNETYKDSGIISHSADDGTFSEYSSDEEILAEDNKDDLYADEEDGEEIEFEDSLNGDDKGGETDQNEDADVPTSFEELISDEDDMEDADQGGHFDGYEDGEDGSAYGEDESDGSSVEDDYSDTGSGESDIAGNEYGGAEHDAIAANDEDAEGIGAESGELQDLSNEGDETGIAVEEAEAGRIEDGEEAVLSGDEEEIAADQNVEKEELASPSDIPILMADEDSYGIYSIAIEKDGSDDYVSIEVQDEAGTAINAVTTTIRKTDGTEGTYPFYQEAIRLNTTYAAAVNGKEYLLLLLSGEYNPSVELKDEDIAYVDQLTAGANGVSFNVYPGYMTDGDYYLYISSDADEGIQDIVKVASFSFLGKYGEEYPEDDGIRVTGVSISNDKLTLKPGKTAQLTATIMPQDATDKGVIWSSSKTDVAKVDADSGKVTAVKAGSSVITVTTIDGGFTASCVVTVEDETPTPDTTVAVSGVTLNRSSLALTVGESGTLSATVSPSNATDKTVSWSSGNTAVATVSNGKVTAVSAGTAVITVKTKSGGYSASCTVTVSAKQTTPQTPTTPTETKVLVSGIALNKATTSLLKGSSETLSATISPSNATDKTVSWSSSNTAVATVSGGKVTAVSVGSATITAKTKDGGYTASCTVTVTGDISSCSATLSGMKFSYDGKAKKPVVTVMDGGTTLASGRDYSVTYKDNKNIGTASVVITGKGSYQGTLSESFKIAAPAKGKVFTVSGIKYKVTNASKYTVGAAGASKKTITSLKIPAAVKIGGKSYKVTSVGAKAYQKYTKLKTVTIGNNVTTIGKNAFNGCTVLTTVNFGKKVKTIGANAFKGCAKLSKLKINSTVLSVIGASAFQGAKKLKTVSLGNTVTEIGANAFNGCTALTTVTLGKKVKIIGASAFKGCTKLNKLTVNSTVLTTIGKQAFFGDKKLKTITFKSSKIKTVGAKAFTSVPSSAKVKVPAKKVSAYKKLFQKAGLNKKAKVQK